MRLSTTEKDIIIETIKKWFGSKTVTLLFGSRINDQLKGGDIDLLIIPANQDNPYMSKINLLTELKLALGDQKIDIIIKRANDKRPIIETALKEGIILE